MLSVSIAQGVAPWSEVNEGVPLTGSFEHYKRVRRGDVVLNRMRAFQGAVGVSAQDGMTSPDYAVLRPTREVSGDYVEMLIQSRPFVAAMTSRLRGIGSTESGAVRTPRVNVGDVLRIGVVLPSYADQALIAARLGKEWLEVGAAIADARQAIALSKERRAALISAAVSGQVDVSERNPVLV